MSLARRAGVFLGCVAYCCTVQTALAQPADGANRLVARKLGNSGVEAFQAGNYALAEEKLNKAYQILQVPSLGLWSARSMVKLGKLIEASERLTQVARIEPSGGDIAVQQQAQREAATDLEALIPKIPNVVIQVVGATPNEVQVAIDGIAASSALIGEGRPVNPGRHKIEGTRGASHVEVDLTIAQGEQRSAVLQFAKDDTTTAPGARDKRDAGGLASPEAPGETGAPGGGNAMRVAGFATLGVGIAGLGVATAFYFSGKSKRTEADDLCGAGPCPLDNRSRIDDLDTAADHRNTMAFVSVVIGGTAVVAGTTLLLLGKPKASGQPTGALRPWFGLDAAGIAGEF